MEDWRAKAVEIFPDLRELVDAEPGVLSLWTKLFDVLARTYEESAPDQNRIENIYTYASWCLRQPNTDSVDSDAANGVAVGFIESIPLDRRISGDLHRWMSAETFDGCEKLFRYHLEDKAFQDFSDAFHRGKTASGKTYGI